MKIKCTSFTPGFTVGCVYRLCLGFSGAFVINDEGVLVSGKEISLKRK